MLNKVNKRLWT